eukprot:g30493.t1
MRERILLRLLQEAPRQVCITCVLACGQKVRDVFDFILEEQPRCRRNPTEMFPAVERALRHFQFEGAYLRANGRMRVLLTRISRTPPFVQGEDGNLRFDQVIRISACAHPLADVKIERVLYWWAILPPDPRLLRGQGNVSKESWRFCCRKGKGNMSAFTRWQSARKLLKKPASMSLPELDPVTGENAIASGLEPIALRFEAMPSRLEAIALSFASLRPARPARNDLSVRDPPSDPRTEPRRTEPSLEAMWLGAETPLGALVEDAECEDAPTNPADPEPEKHQLGPSDVLELGTSLSPAPVESPQSEESNAPVLEPEVPILESASIASILRSDTADADAELRADPTEAPLPEAPTLPGERPIGEGGFPEEQEMVVSGSEDAQVYIWHRHYGSLLQVLAGHSATVNTVCWVRAEKDNAWLISASDDGTLRVWGCKEEFREAPETEAALVSPPIRDRPPAIMHRAPPRLPPRSPRETLRAESPGVGSQSARSGRSARATLLTEEPRSPLTLKQQGENWEGFSEGTRTANASHPTQCIQSCSNHSTLNAEQPVRTVMMMGWRGDSWCQLRFKVIRSNDCHPKLKLHEAKELPQKFSGPGPRAEAIERLRAEIFPAAWDELGVMEAATAPEEAELELLRLRRRLATTRRESTAVRQTLHEALRSNVESAKLWSANRERVGDLLEEEQAIEAVLEVHESRLVRNLPSVGLEEEVEALREEVAEQAEDVRVQAEKQILKSRNLKIFKALAKLQKARLRANAAVAEAKGWCCLHIAGQSTRSLPSFGSAAFRRTWWTIEGVGQ